MGRFREFFTGSNPVTEYASDPQKENLNFSTTPVDWDALGGPAFYGFSSSPFSPAPRIDRKAAVQVPAVKRSRDLIAGSLGGLPLDLYGPRHETASNPLFEQPERNVPRSVTMTRTVEDLLFEGVAWWRITEFSWTNYPSKVRRIDPRRVSVNDDEGKVFIDGKHVDDQYLIRFDSPTDGLLIAGARAIRTCLELDAAAARYASEPQPLGYFSPADGETDPASDQDVIDILNGWATARQTRATGYVPASLKYNVTQFDAEKIQLSEARQHAVLEIARAAGIDPEELGVSTTSRTYSNQFDRRKAFIDFTLGQFRQAIEDRLSMGDVTPRGYFAKFNLSAFLRSDDLSRYTALEKGLAIGAVSREEIRALEDRPPLTPSQQEAPVAQPAPALETVGTVETFDAAETVTFDAPSAPDTFSVDRERRIIRGLALPYGVVSNDGRTFNFSKGSVTFSEPSRIKLLVAHDWSQAIGVATALEDTDAGLVASFKVARGPEGDRALSMAEDGVWDGLSVGLGKGMKTRLEDGVQHVVSAQLREVSQTPCPAYDGARITEVAASADHEGNTTMTETIEPEKVDFSALTDALSAGIKTGFADLALPQRETVNAAERFEVTEPSPYRFDGIAGEHSFIEDMRNAQQGDADARQRLEKFGEEFAVTTTNVGTLNPTVNRPDLYVGNLQYSRPLWDSVSTGTITDKTPFTVPKFSAAAGLVGTHTEGVEPTPGSFSATSMTVTPTALSGKIEINREVLDQGGSPQADAIIWGEMVNGWYEAIEARIATALAAVPTAELNLAGATDATLVNSLTDYFAGLQFVRGGNRFTAFVADGQLFPKLVSAADTTGRKLLPVLGASNAQGTTSGGFDRIQIGSQTVRAAWALGATNASKSYSFVPSSVWAWASAPKRFVFEYQIKSVDLAIWGYGATAVLRDSDVKPIDWTTADV